jgi:hypothetical protein
VGDCREAFPILFAGCLGHLQCVSSVFPQYLCVFHPSFPLLEVSQHRNRALWGLVPLPGVAARRRRQAVGQLLGQGRDLHRGRHARLPRAMTTSPGSLVGGLEEFAAHLGCPEAGVRPRSRPRIHQPAKAGLFRGGGKGPTSALALVPGSMGAVADAIAVAELGQGLLKIQARITGDLCRGIIP